MARGGCRLGACREKPVVVGIDEAGRGPLVGPLVMAAVALPVELLGGLRGLGVRDSKQLTASSRQSMLEEILEAAPVVLVAYHPPELIDSVNLNELEYDTASHLLRRVLLHCCDIRAVYADAVGPPEKYAARLRAAAPGLRIVVAPRADARYTATAAASIVAKVMRDAVIEEYRRAYGLRGSGYPTDPETLEWVRQLYEERPQEPPPIIRRTWATLKKIAPQWYRSKKASRRKEAGHRTLLDYLRPSKGG